MKVMSVGQNALMPLKSNYFKREYKIIHIYGQKIAKLTIHTQGNRIDNIAFQLKSINI